MTVAKRQRLRVTMGSIVRNLRSTLVVLSMSVLLAACPFDGDSGAKRPEKSELVQVLDALESLQTQLNGNSTGIRDLQQRADLLEANVIPCTLDRYINNQCGDQANPFDLTVSLCSDVAGNAGVAGSFEINNNNSLNLGIGWDWGADGNIDRTIEFPGIPGIGWATLATTGNPAGFLFGSPFPNLQAGVDASVGLGLDGCIDVPIDLENVPRDQVIALMESWQAQGEALQQSIVATSNRLDYEPARISSALAALETVQSKSLSAAADANLSDPFEFFSRGSALGRLIEILPIGDQLQEVLDNPGVLVESFAVDLSTN